MCTLSRIICFCFCHAATQRALQLQQERIQVVFSNEEARKRPDESNGTPAMDLGHVNVILKWCECMLAVDLGIVLNIMITIMFFCLFVCWYKNPKILTSPPTLGSK